MEESQSSIVHPLIDKNWRTNTMKRHFEYTDDVSNKFWKINLNSKNVSVCYGRIGIQNPHEIIKEFETKEKAKKFAETKIREKENKGYIEV